MNRFYRPSAPRYTSQFVEDMYPTDMLMQFGAMKQGQQAAFAEGIGELQGLVAATPNGYRTSEMAPIVRQKWSNNINEWATKNLNNYDSTQAISELMSLRTQFQNDPDIRVMRQDYEDTDFYKQLLAKSGVGDINPNLNYAGELKQFKPGQPYSSYQQFIGYQDVPKRVLDELNLVTPQITHQAERKAVTDPVTGMQIAKEYQGDIEFRNMEMMESTLRSLANRAVENKEDWARYLNEADKQKFGRTRTAEELYNDFKQNYGVKSQIYRPRMNTSWEYIPEGYGGGAGQQTGDSSNVALNWDATVKSAKENKIMPNLVRNIGRERERRAKANQPYDMKSNLDYYNMYNMVKNATNAKGQLLYPGFEKMPIDEQTKIINNEIVKPYRDATTNLGFSVPDNDIRQEVAKRFSGSIDANGKVTIDAGSKFWVGQPLYDYDTMELIQDDDKNFNKKDSHVQFDGPIADEYVKYAPAPGLVGFQITDKSGESRGVLAMLPELKERQRADWNYNSFLRSSSGVGDGFTMEINHYDNGVGVRFHDVSDPGVETARNVGANVRNPKSIHVIPYIDYNDGSKIKYDVFASNPMLYNNGDDSGIADKTDELYLKTYDLATYGSVKALHEQILNDTKSTDANINPLLMKQQKFGR